MVWNFFVPEAKVYCISLGLDWNYKILLLLVNFSAHPSADQFLKNNVAAAYFPPKCTSLIQPHDQGKLCSFKYKYHYQFLKRLLYIAGTSVEIFINLYSMKDVLWLIAIVWQLAGYSSLKNWWHKLWAGVMIEPNPCEDPDVQFTGFLVSKEKLF